MIEDLVPIFGKDYLEYAMKRFSMYGINNVSIKSIDIDTISIIFDRVKSNLSEDRFAVLAKIILKMKDALFEPIRSYINIYDDLDRNEIRLLQYLMDNEVEVKDKLELDRKANSFKNLRILTNSLPTDVYESMDKARPSVEHLISKNIVEWPVTRQEPIIENGAQVGVTRSSKIGLTNLGKGFVSFVLR